MAHNTEQVGFPAIPLNPGMQLRLRSLSPTTDATVAGVIFTEWSIYGYDESPPPPDPTPDPGTLGIPYTGR